MMNHCRDIELELAAYSSGDLGPAERDRVRNHLDDCAQCRAELAREINLRETLGSLPKVKTPDVLAQKIKAATYRPAATMPGERKRGRLTAVLVLAAASLAIALLAPALRPVSGPDQTWTEEEIAAARQEVLYTLTLTAKVIDRTQREAVIKVFADKLPHAIDKSFKAIKPTTSGGNG